MAAGSSSEKRGALDESLQFPQGPSESLQPPQLASSPSQRDIKVEELTESSTAGLQSPEQCEKPAEKKEEKAEDTTQKLGKPV